MFDPQLFGERYRIKSARAYGWDYGSRAAYFITIITRERIPWFGDIQNGHMILSDIGRMVDDEWNNTAKIRPYISLDSYVVMPDHFHGIIRIDKRNVVQTPRRGVSTKNPFHKPEWKRASLGSIINQFKSVCTKRIRTSCHPDFAWQSRFHDRAIRNGDELKRIRRYIIDNPANWKPIYDN
jgi:putative transposase